VSPDLRRRVATVLLAPFVIGVAACGGGGGEDPEELLDKAFRSEIRSADIKVDATIQLTGSQSFNRPVRIQASGPFVRNEGKLPSVNLALKIGSGGGQTVETGFLSTGDRAFVQFEDVYYEQPAEQVRQANASIRRNQGRRGSLKSLGLDPRSWLADASNEGEEKVAGADATHVSGKLDVKAFLRDLNEFVKKSRTAIGGATGQPPPPPIGEDDIERASKAVSEPSFDVYVGDDDTIRRVAGRVDVKVPEEDRAEAGIERGALEFSLEFRDVNGDQEIEAPAKARPLSDLTRSLGTAPLGGGLGGGMGGDGSGGDGSGGASPPTGTTTGPDAEAFQEYADCLERARPEDTDALQRCAQLLQQR
jgi:hypothetical protein